MYGIRSSRCYIYYATVFWTIAITPASMIIKGRPIFDIIAGTSIGAINAAFLVSYVVENQTYEGVHYDKVITSDHVIASGSFPVNLEPSMPILLV